MADGAAPELAPLEVMFFPGSPVGEVEVVLDAMEAVLGVGGMELLV